jgi:sec-independent protein translocase protein TatB
MFDIGFSELVLIGLIALIVLGPKRLPEAARTAGRWVRTVRGFVASVKQDLAKELQAEDLKEFKRLQEELAEARSALRQSTSQITSELNERVGGDTSGKSATRAGSPAKSDDNKEASGEALTVPPAKASGDAAVAAGASTGHGDGESSGNG